QQQPGAVGGLEAVAVGLVPLHDLQAGDVFRVGAGDSGESALTLARVELDVDAVVEVLADLAVELLHQLRWRLASAGDEVEEEEAGEGAVALGDVAGEGVAAALLARGDGVGLDHLRAEKLEANLRLVDGHVVLLAQTVDHARARQRSDERAAHAAVLEQV